MVPCWRRKHCRQRCLRVPTTRPSAILVSPSGEQRGRRDKGDFIVTYPQLYRTPAALAPRVSRELARLSDQTDVALARLAAGAEVEGGKLDALDYLSGRAMQGVALVSQLEQQLSTAVPIAHSRLQAIGDMHALASAEVVASAPRRLS